MRDINSITRDSYTKAKNIENVVKSKKLDYIKTNFFRSDFFIFKAQIKILWL